MSVIPGSGVDPEDIEYTEPAPLRRTLKDIEDRKEKHKPKTEDAIESKSEPSKSIVTKLRQMCKWCARLNRVIETRELPYNVENETRSEYQNVKISPDDYKLFTSEFRSLSDDDDIADHILAVMYFLHRCLRIVVSDDTSQKEAKKLFGSKATKLCDMHTASRQEAEKAMVAFHDKILDIIKKNPSTILHIKADN